MLQIKRVFLYYRIACFTLFMYSFLIYFNLTLGGFPQDRSTSITEINITFLLGFCIGNCLVMRRSLNKRQFYF